jgi:hypothetical protein
LPPFHFPPLLLSLALLLPRSPSLAILAWGPLPCLGCVLTAFCNLLVISEKALGFLLAISQRLARGR